jgi:predicted MFS family arabinose efflux permease
VTAASATGLEPRLATRDAVAVFLIFAFSYFISALVRGVTATLAPVFTTEIGLTAGDLGLLGGAFFLGFATTQLPLGAALDRYGPKRVQLVFLAIAVLGCAAFAAARDFPSLALARALIGVGVSACLMAPLTTFRRSFDSVAQLRANSWMLMSGSVGMVASTLPVQWLLPLIGWRGLFCAIAVWMLLSMLAIARFVPTDTAGRTTLRGARPREPGDAAGYSTIWRHPTFVRLAPLGFFHYGGFIAVQSLWAGPWLIEVCGWSVEAAASGLFLINVAVLLSFLGWGSVVPRLYARGWTAQRLVARGVPFSIAALLLVLTLGEHATAWHWAIFCASCSVVSLSQPAVGQAFPAVLAGRALSAYNLVVFLGVFCLQWGIGLAIDFLRSLGWDAVSAYRGGFALLLACCSLSYVWFLCRPDGAASSKTNRPT